MKKYFLIYFGMMVMTILLMIGSFRFDETQSLTGWLEFELLGTWYVISLIPVCFYPLHQFKKLCPNLGGFFNAPSITASLPVLKQTLFLRKLIPWFFACPLFIMINIVCYAAAYRYIYSISLRQAIHLVAPQAFQFVWFIFMISFIVMIIAIYCLSRGKKMLPYFIGLILLHLICIGTIFQSTESFNFYRIGVSVISLILFLISFKDIEKIYQ